jgi:DNA-directed RNA polymerase specialized sigma24 family protein
MKLPIRRIHLKLLRGRGASLEAAEAEGRGKSEFETLVKLHQGAVYAYFRSRLLQSTDAEDLTQEAFLR